MPAFRQLALCILIPSLAARAEIEGEFRFREFERYPDKWITLPIAISVEDANGNPIEGASVALMRLGDGGYTERDVLNSTNPRTNDSGIAVIGYRAGLVGEGPFDLERKHSKLIGEVTVVHAGFKTISIELEDRFPRLFETRDTSFAPWLRIVLKPSKPKKNAEAGSGQPATRIESDSEGGDEPQPESKGCSR